MNAVIYARYSSDTQRHESITAQLRACHAYAERKGYEVVREYIDEAYSARSDDRPAFQRMIADSRLREFDVVICHKIDRFSRNRIDAAIYKQKLHKNSVTVDYSEHNIDGSPESGLLEGVLESVAEFYSRNLGREALKGMRENAYNATHNGGIPPLGYNVTPDKKLSINETEADAVRIIFDMKAAGESYGPIIAELNQRGYRTKSGNTFGKNSLYDILCNKKYIGTYTFGKSSGGRSQKRNSHKPSSDLIEIPDAIPAIIDKDVFEKVQQIMNGRKLNARHTAKEIYLLSGKIFCAECGSAMSGNRVKNKDGSYYVYYQCCARHNKQSCASTRINRNVIEQQVLDKLRTDILAPAIRQTVIKQIADQSELSTRKSANELITLEKQRNKVLKVIDKILDFISENEADTHTKEKYKQHVAQAAELAQRIDEIKKAGASKALTPEQIKVSLATMTTTGTDAELITTFVDNVIVDKESVTVNFYFGQ